MPASSACAVVVEYVLFTVWSAGAGCGAVCGSSDASFVSDFFAALPADASAPGGSNVWRWRFRRSFWSLPSVAKAHAREPAADRVLLDVQHGAHHAQVAFREVHRERHFLAGGVRLVGPHEDAADETFTVVPRKEWPRFAASATRLPSVRARVR
jgi:hypothetical protein